MWGYAELRERFLAIPNNSNTHTSFGAWSPGKMMLMPCSRARETCRQGCQVRANGAVHASHNRERDALCMVGHVCRIVNGKQWRRASTPSEPLAASSLAGAPVRRFVSMIGATWTHPSLSHLSNLCRREYSPEFQRFSYFSSFSCYTTSTGLRRGRLAGRAEPLATIMSCTVET